MRAARGSLLVSEVMSSPVVTAFPEDSIRTVAVKMQRNKIGSIIIANRSRKPLGIITQGDIVRKIVVKSKTRLMYAKAKDIMSKPLFVTAGGKSMEEAARMMVAKGVKKLGVVDGNGNLIGVITDNDIMRNGASLIGVLREIIDARFVGAEE